MTFAPPLTARFVIAAPEAGIELVEQDHLRALGEALLRLRLLLLRIAVRVEHRSQPRRPS